MEVNREKQLRNKLTEFLFSFSGSEMLTAGAFNFLKTKKAGTNRPGFWIHLIIRYYFLLAVFPFKYSSRKANVFSAVVI